MKLRQIVIDKTDLTLTKEKKVIGYGKEFTVEDEARAEEILRTAYKGKPVAELVKEEEPKEEKPIKKTKKKAK